MSKFRKRQLICGCCGQYFSTWKEYVDQDQDKGYGICSSCQIEIKQKEEEEFNKMIDAISGAFKDPANLKKFQEMDRDLQKAYCLQAIEDGIITFEIKPR
jgi:hypothetical protein